MMFENQSNCRKPTGSGYETFAQLYLCVPGWSLTVSAPRSAGMTRSPSWTLPAGSLLSVPDVSGRTGRQSCECPGTRSSGSSARTVQASRLTRSNIEHCIVLFVVPPFRIVFPLSVKRKEEKWKIIHFFANIPFFFSFSLPFFFKLWENWWWGGHWALPICPPSNSDPVIPSSIYVIRYTYAVHIKTNCPKENILT